MDAPNGAKLFAGVKFVSDNTKRLNVTLKQLEGQQYFAVTIHNMVNDLEACKTKDYGDLTHRMTVSFARELHAKFVLAFEENVSKLKAYTNMDTGNLANKLWKAALIFDPRQVPSLSNNIADFAPP